MYGLPIRPRQTIQPYEHGDGAKKATCLWLKNLPLLIPTNSVCPGEFHISPNGKRFSCGASADMAKDENGKIVSNGGRVLAVTSFGATFVEATKKSYQTIENLKFDKMNYRKDIGFDL